MRLTGRRVFEWKQTKTSQKRMKAILIDSAVWSGLLKHNDFYRNILRLGRSDESSSSGFSQKMKQERRFGTKNDGLSLWKSFFGRF